MKILNLYAGIGGNRKLWGDEHEITAIEYDKDIAAVYAELFPNDTVIVTDAHKFLLEHFEEFDFIWSSPPCPTHGQIRFRTGVLSGRVKPIYPDMRLYAEIILLKHHFKGKWVVENVESYYKPLIECVRVGRHQYWANFIIPPKNIKNGILKDIVGSKPAKGFDLSGFNVKNKRLLLRNAVEPEIGKHVFDSAIK